MDPVFAASLPQLQYGTGSQITMREGGHPRGARNRSMNQIAQRKRARIMAVILAAVAIAFYLGFMLATANGF